MLLSRHFRFLFRSLPPKGTIALFVMGTIVEAGRDTAWAGEPTTLQAQQRPSPVVRAKDKEELGGFNAFLRETLRRARACEPIDFDGMGYPVNDILIRAVAEAVVREFPGLKEEVSRFLNLPVSGTGPVQDFQVPEEELHRLRELAKTGDSATAIREAMLLPGKKRLTGLKAVYESWAEVDPEAALGHLKSFGLVFEPKWIEAGISVSWFTKDPKAFAASGRVMDWDAAGSPAKVDETQMIARLKADGLDAQGMLEWLASHTTGSGPRMLDLAVAALTETGKIPDAKLLKTVRCSPVAVVEACLEKAEINLDTLDRAGKFIDLLATESDRKYALQQLGSKLNATLDNDTSSLSDMRARIKAAGLAEGDASAVFDGILSARLNIDVLGTLEAISSEISPGAAQTTALGLIPSVDDAETAWQSYSRFGEGDESADSALVQASSLDPAFYLERLKDDEKLSRQVLDGWIQSDTWGASDYIHALPQSPQKDYAIGQLVGTIQESDPAGAIIWSTSASDPGLRQALLKAIAAKSGLESFRNALKSIPGWTEEQILNTMNEAELKVNE